MSKADPEFEDLQNKLHDLEAKSAFQEDAMNQLNSVVIKQQQQLDHLNIVIDALRGAVQSVNSAPQMATSAEDEKPPHY